MKSGFYLSPDGLRIVEIIFCTGYDFDYNVFLKPFHSIMMTPFEVGIIFSSWSRLK
jgi:hypothetical protein